MLFSGFGETCEAEKEGFEPSIQESGSSRGGSLILRDGQAVSVPPMPKGFTDRTAWDAIHWRFTGGPVDAAVIAWQRDNQERVKAAAEAAVHPSSRMGAT